MRHYHSTISSLHLLTLARRALDDVVHAKNHLRRLRRGHKHLQGSLHKERGKERGTVKYLHSRCVRRIPLSLNSHGYSTRTLLAWGAGVVCQKQKRSPWHWTGTRRGYCRALLGEGVRFRHRSFHTFHFVFFSSSRCAPDTTTCVETQRKKKLAMVLL